MAENLHKVHLPGLPPYSIARHLITILNGVPKVTLAGLLEMIYEQMGTPQNPVDWSDPDKWIADRLRGPQAELAQRFWKESDHGVNPRHLRNPYMFINRYELLVSDSNGRFQQTQRGRAFLERDGMIVRDIDDAEGLLQLLTILATKTRARRGDLLPEWSAFLLKHSNFGSSSTFKGTLRHRLVNLVERGLVAREGQSSYVITESGLEYVSGPSPRPDPKRYVLLAITTFNDSQRKVLKEQLGKMKPYRFEHLVRELLEAMGYEDVQVTKASGDKGVDVVATVQFGITTITEVVQVKRHQGTIGRQVLDQLRGALPYHKAIRGTIVTTGNFSNGCKEAALYPGAAPIGLIDGGRLLDLLFEHKIALKEQPATLYELDEAYFSDAGESVLEMEEVEEIDDN